MNSPAMKLKRTDATVKQLLALTFPNYAGRKITARASEKVWLDSTMDGGTGSEWVVVNLATMETKRVPQVSPMTAHIAGPGSAAWALAWGEGKIQPNMVYAERYHFCGKLIGVTFHIHPDTMSKTLEAAK